MSYAGWPATNLANLFPAGIKRAMVKRAGDTAFYNPGIPADTNARVTELFKADTKLRQYGYGYGVEVISPAIQASLTELELIHLLLNVNLIWKFDLMGSDNLTLEIPNGLSGVIWKIICGGGMDGARTIEYTVKGNLKRTEMDALFTTTPTADGTPGADALLAFSQVQKPAQVVPNGIDLLEFKAAADGSYFGLGDLGADSNYTFETIPDLGGGGRGIPRIPSIKFMGDFFGLETQDAKLNFLDVGAQVAHDIRITHMDGVILTLDDADVNATWRFLSEGDADKFRRLHLHVEGTITNFASTGWTGLWA